jgi:hypothetical protein
MTWPRLGAILAGGVVLLAGCGTKGRHSVAPSELVSLAVSGHGPQRIAHVHAAPGVRVNALLRPSLEFHDGTVITFAGEESALDSGYFAGSPHAAIGGTSARTALLRASVCPAAQRVCLSIAVDVDLPR